MALLGAVGSGIVDPAKALAEKAVDVAGPLYDSGVEVAPEIKGYWDEEEKLIDIAIHNIDNDIDYSFDSIHADRKPRMSIRCFKSASLCVQSVWEKQESDREREYTRRINNIRSIAMRMLKDGKITL
jgi:hypothetical protein